MCLFTRRRAIYPRSGKRVLRMRIRFFRSETWQCLLGDGVNRLMNNRRLVRGIAIVLISVFSSSAQQAKPQQATVTPDIEAALADISADSLRGHLSFIASDALEGRNTPSPGLDIAAEYIAAQFRRAKLEPAGDQDYFQTANFVVSETPMDAFELKLKSGPETISVAKNQVSFNIDRELKVSAPVFKIDYSDKTALAQLKPEQIEGKAVLTEIPDLRRAEESRRMETYQTYEQFLGKMTELKAALVISIDRYSASGSGGGQGRLIDPENRRAVPQFLRIPQINVHDPKSRQAAR